MKKYKCIKCDWISADINNKSGSLTKHALNHNIEDISGLFNMIECKEEKIHCPMCDWDTTDILNKSGTFTTHIIKTHSITIDEFLKIYPVYNNLWKTHQKSNDLVKFVNDNANNSIKCMECGKLFRKLTNKHLIKHNLTPTQYKNKHNVTTTCSKTTENLQRKKSFETQINNILDRITSHDCIPLFDENSYTGVDDNKKYPFQCKLCDNKFEDTLDNGKFPICRICNPKLKLHPNKKAENEIFLFLCECVGKDKILTNDRKIIYPSEVDFYIPHLNFAIEYDGLFWHSELYRDKKYHLEKTLKLKNIGVRTIHIFEDEWINNKELIKKKIKHIIKISQCNRIYARNCEVRVVKPDECNNFLKSHHIQGTDSSYVKLGLYHSGSLVSVMTFSKPRIALGNTGKEKFIELSRFASNTDYIVIGAAGRLFSYFLEIHNPSKIISYADLRWSSFDDNLYKKLRFTMKHQTPPNFFWCKNGKRYHRFNFTKASLIKRGYDAAKTANQIMREIGYYRIWDCGHLKYELTI